MICKSNMEELLPEVQGIIRKLKENRENLKTVNQSRNFYKDVLSGNSKPSKFWN